MPWGRGLSINAMHVTPAYGRDYRSRNEAMKHWYEGKDFILQDPSSPWDGKPVNIEDAKGAPVYLRYKNKRKVCQLQ